MSRRRRDVELGEYLGFVRRALRGAGRRVGRADPEDLAQLVELRAELDRVIDEAVLAMRAGEHVSNGPGYSWSQIGRALGYAPGKERQSAQQRYGKRAAERAARREQPVDVVAAPAHDHELPTFLATRERTRAEQLVD